MEKTYRNRSRVNVHRTVLRRVLFLDVPELLAEIWDIAISVTTKGSQRTEKHTFHDGHNLVWSISEAGKVLVDLDTAF